MNDSVQIGEDQSQSQVSEQLCILGKASCAIRDSVAELRARLSPCLRTEPPCTSGDGKPERELVPFAADIRSKRENIDAAQAVLDEVLRTLEL